MHLEHQIDGSKPQDWYNMSTSLEQRKCTGACLTHWKDILRTRTTGLHKYKRDTKSGVWCGKRTPEGYHNACEGYHEYTEVFNFAKDFSLN